MQSDLNEQTHRAQTPLTIYIKKQNTAIDASSRRKMRRKASIFDFMANNSWFDNICFPRNTDRRTFLKKRKVSNNYC